jgi:hypothetical protein
MPKTENCQSFLVLATYLESPRDAFTTSCNHSSDSIIVYSYSVLWLITTLCSIPHSELHVLCVFVTQRVFFSFAKIQSKTYLTPDEMVTRATMGETQIWSLGSDDGDAWRCSSLRASVWSRCCLEVVLRWSGVSLSASTTASLSSVEQRGLEAYRVMSYKCGTEELSDVVVALTA